MAASLTSEPSTCSSETVAVAFTAEERERTEEPFVKAVITQISADESLHARFGWAFAQEATPHLDAAARARTRGGRGCCSRHQR